MGCVLKGEWPESEYDDIVTIIHLVKKLIEDTPQYLQPSNTIWTDFSVNNG